MFVRFREHKNDGREPEGMQASIACARPGQCHLGQERRRAGGGMRTTTGCPMKPRCGWRIEGVVPYRLQVSLVENKRVDGKVRQEHIADLGAIDGYMLPSFYPDGAPQDEAWTRQSVRLRDAFWQNIEQVLSRLGNRIDPEYRNELRAAIHARIPMLTVDEREALPKWQTKEQVFAWHRMADMYVSLITQAEKDSAQHEQAIKHLREGIAQFQPAVDQITEWTNEVDRVGPQGFEEVFDKTNMTLGRILADRAVCRMPTDRELDEMIEKSLDEDD